MSVLARVTSARITFASQTHPTTYIITDAGASSVVEIKSSKSREVRRNVDRERRPSVQREEVRIMTERRGSRDAGSWERRKSSLGLTNGEGEIDAGKRRKSVFESKKKVYVVVG